MTSLTITHVNNSALLIRQTVVVIFSILTLHEIGGIVFVFEEKVHGLPTGPGFAAILENVARTTVHGRHTPLPIPTLHGLVLFRLQGRGQVPSPFTGTVFALHCWRSHSVGKDVCSARGGGPRTRTD